jgi:flagellum-specific ATP synthase
VTALAAEIQRIPDRLDYGRVTAVLGMLVEVGGAPASLSVGDRCSVLARGRAPVACEVVGFRAGRALMMPFGPLEGVGLGCKTIVAAAEPVIRPHPSWLGRVLDALGNPIDQGGALPQGREPYKLRAAPPPANQRRRVGGKIDLGVRAINTFLTCCRGQRLGIFSASGVGKSILLGMLARFTKADVAVIGLIGERGREVQEFIEDNLGAAGLKRSVLVVATSDESPLVRRQAAYLTLAVAEYFRDQGKDVLCMIDSITRFAQAQREIGLTAGEPPATKGYTPTVFAELPKVLERAGPGTGEGTITGLFTVLVEGDDHDEPVSDAVRATIDGHIVLDRAIAERGRYPAVSVLRSVSRVMPNCNTPEENALVTHARRLISRYEDMADMIRLGAYRKGSDAETDEAIARHDALEDFLAQDQGERADLASGYARLAEILAADKKGRGR